jgi:hypothetical protein
LIEIHHLPFHSHENFDPIFSFVYAVSGAR